MKDDKMQLDIEEEMEHICIDIDLHLNDEQLFVIERGLTRMWMLGWQFANQ